MFPALKFDEEEEGQFIWEASRAAASLPPLGRVLSTIFNAEWRNVEKALSSDGSPSQQGSIGRALTTLLEHVETRLSTSASLGQILIPMLEHAIKSKDHGNRRKIVGVFRWLFAGTKYGQLLASSLASIGGSEKVDHRVQLGWCVVVRELVEKEAVLYRSLPSVQTDEEPSELKPPLMCFTKCVHPLIQIICKESLKQGKHKLPTRLTMAAADCVTVITKGLVSDPPAASTKMTEKLEKNEERVLITPTSSENECDVFSNNDEAMASTSGRETENDLKERGARALWDNLDDIILLVVELQEWNVQGRPLHARGLQQVLKRLRFLATYRDSLETPAGDAENIQVGVSVLAACWRQYSSLILLEDRTLVSNPDPVIEHWCGGLQHWTQAAEESDASETRRPDEMRGYALTCLALILGRLDPRRLEEVLKDIEPELLQTLMNQVRAADIEVVDMAMAILRSLLFRSSAVTSKMEEIVPVLMDMLDTRDSAARAVVLLVAEFFALNPASPELERVLARLGSEDPLQRRNGLDVLTELVAISTKLTETVDTPLSRTIAVHLFDRLGDEELTNRVEASALFAKLDPLFALPQLVRLVYSPDARKRSAASSAVEAVLCGHDDQLLSIIVLLDYLRDLMAETASADKAAGSKKVGASLDLDRVLRSVPAWASKVQNFQPLIKALLDKMYTEASNPVIPRFMSHLSDQLADMPNSVFPWIHQRMNDQPKMSEGVLTNVSESEDALATFLFQRLSPMLVLRILPLKAFDHFNSKELYGGLLDGTASGEGQDQVRASSITGILLERMFDSWELDDVRKIAAELTGRLLPDAILPALSAALEKAAQNINPVTAKACLFSLCTSLMIRGRETLEHSFFDQIPKSLSSIILWSPNSLKGSKEIAKAQHGCIDCFAAMICAEVGTVGIVSPIPSKPVQGDQKMKKLIEEIPEEWKSHAKGKQEPQRRWKILSSVVECVVGGQPITQISTTLGLSEVEGGCEDAQLAPEVFRVCMANVLISSSQKISASVRPAYAVSMIPPLMSFVQASAVPKLRAACFQVLFTSVYHLKGQAIAPFAADLLNLSIYTIGGRYSTEERTAGTKLLASLLASEDSVLKEIAPFIEDARRAVATVVNMDSSPQLRGLCEQLLSCMTKTE